MIDYSPELVMTGVPIRINNLITSEEKPYVFYMGTLYCNKEGYKKLKEGVKKNDFYRGIIKKYNHRTY